MTDRRLTRRSRRGTATYRHRTPRDACSSGFDHVTHGPTHSAGRSCGRFGPTLGLWLDQTRSSLSSFPFRKLRRCSACAMTALCAAISSATGFRWFVLDDEFAWSLAPLRSSSRSLVLRGLTKQFQKRKTCATANDRRKVRPWHGSPSPAQQQAEAANGSRKACGGGTARPAMHPSNQAFRPGATAGSTVSGRMSLASGTSDQWTPRP
jgi:hypothetical protein